MSAVVSSSTGECGRNVDNSGCRLRSIASLRKSSSKLSNNNNNNNQTVGSPERFANNNNNNNNNTNNNNPNNGAVIPESVAGNGNGNGIVRSNGNSNTNTNNNNCDNNSESTLRRAIIGSHSRSDRSTSTAGAAVTITTSTTEKDASTNRVITTNTASAAVPNGTTPSNSSIKQCCFHWCCCCPCSCLAVKAVAHEEVRLEYTSPDIMQIFDDDNMPTLEEVQIWGESFDRLMKSENGRKIFREFLRGEYSEENILFWLACEELKMETNPSIVEERARFIYEDYISILSPKEVSLDSRVREMINKTISMPRPNMFDEAQTQIFTLMHRDSYPRFINSQVYKDLLDSATSSKNVVASTSSSSAGTTAKPSSNVRKKNVS